MTAPSDDPDRRPLRRMTAQVFDDQSSPRNVRPRLDDQLEGWRRELNTCAQELQDVVLEFRRCEWKEPPVTDRQTESLLFYTRSLTEIKNRVNACAVEAIAENRESRMRAFSSLARE